MKKIVYIDSLTSLRGIAAMLILLSHFNGYAYFPHIETLGIPVRNNLWVDFFFILSGFVLALNYGTLFENAIHKKDYILFMWKRFIRIYPVHITALLAMVLVELYRITMYHKMSTPLADPAFGSTGPTSYPELFYNLFLVHSWGLHKNNLTWNIPSWSISCEWFAYFIFPWLFLSLYRLKSLFRNLLLLLLSYYVLISFNETGTDLNTLIFRGLLGMGAGIFLFRIYISSDALPVFLRSDYLIGIILFVCIFFYQMFSSEFFCILLFIMLIYLVAYNRGRAARILCHPILKYLGMISYSLYLWNWVVLNFLDITVYYIFRRGTSSFDSLQNGGLFLIFFFVTIIVSSASYYVLERMLPRLLGVIWANDRLHHTESTQHTT